MHGLCCARWLVEREVDVHCLGRARRVNNDTVIVLTIARFEAIERGVEAREEAAGCREVRRLRRRLLDIRWPWSRESFAKLDEARAVAAQRALPRGEKVLSYFAPQSVQVKVLALFFTAWLASLQVDPVALQRARVGRGARFVEASFARISEEV